MKTEISIIGGGFSGLTMAYLLHRKGLKVKVYESDLIGGSIQTMITSNMQVETAANAFLLTPLLQKIAQEIGCELIRVRPQARARYIWRDGFRKWPVGVLSTLIILFRFLPRWLFMRQSLRPHPYETVKDWGLRHYNAEIVDYLLAPALQGIYAGDIEKLSATLILNRFFASEKNTQNLGSAAPINGMGEFFLKLSQLLKSEGVVIEKKYIQNLSEISGPKVLAVSLPSLLRLRPEFLTHELKLLNFARITAGFHESDSQRIQGFGVLFPHNQGFEALGVIANSQIFSHRGSLNSESWIIGGALNPHVLKKSDQDLMDLVEIERAKIFSTKDKILAFKVVRCPEAYVHYDLTLESWLGRHKLELRNFEKRIWTVGNYLGALGLSQILEENEKLSQEIVSELCKK